MPVGGYYIKLDGADELRRALEGTERGIKDLSRAHRTIGQELSRDVLRREPLSSGGNNRAGHNRGTTDGYLQMHTKGGGGKTGAYVEAEAPYVYLQEFGGTSFWYSSGGMRGQVRAFDTFGGTSYKHKMRKVPPRDLASIAKRWGLSGHTVYTKPRNTWGYFIWNVAYRLRDRIGREYWRELQSIAARENINLEIASGSLGLEPEEAPGGMR